MDKAFDVLKAVFGTRPGRRLFACVVLAAGLAKVHLDTLAEISRLEKEIAYIKEETAELNTKCSELQEVIAQAHAEAGIDAEAGIEKSKPKTGPRNGHWTVVLSSVVSDKFKQSAAENDFRRQTEKIAVQEKRTLSALEGMIQGHGMTVSLFGKKIASLRARRPLLRLGYVAIGMWALPSLVSLVRIKRRKDDDDELPNNAGGGEGAGQPLAKVGRA